MHSETQVGDQNTLSTALPPETGLLTPSQVARRLQVSSAWVRDHATRKQPRLRSVKVGKLLRFRPQDVDEFIRQWCQ
jgi:excisionase family DNA binding protein